MNAAQVADHVELICGITHVDIPDVVRSGVEVGGKSGHLPTVHQSCKYESRDSRIVIV
jgi:hypothetical protein